MNITKKLLDKVCTIIIIVALTVSDFLFVGTELASYAIDMVKTNSSNVDFSAYFINQYGEKVEKLEKSINMDEEYLYVDISVKNEGYFNGTISLENNNFNLKQNKLSQDIAKISGNQVKLNQINAGSTVTIKLGIEAISDSTINESMLDQKTKILLSGQYINSKNVEKNKFVEIKGTDEVELAWKSSEETKAELESKVLTNYVYDVENEQKRIVQILVESKITNNNYPVKNTEINVSVPEKVTDVKVHARKTDATNSSVNFDANNYEYNKETHNLKIMVKNENKKSISWNKNAKDTFVITYVFDKDEDVKNKNIKVESKINTYDNKTLTENMNFNIKEEIDGIVSYSIETENSIHKGKIQIGQERDFENLNIINVDYIGPIDEISVKFKESNFLANNSEIQANITHKETKIYGDEFFKIFGQDGFIIVKDDKGNVIANINKNTEKDEGGNFVINFFEGTKYIEITTSKPIAVGTLNIVNNKTILNNEYKREEVKSFTGIKETIEGSYNKKENVREEAKIELKNSETKANLNVSVDKLSAVNKNENVKITAVLLNNDESKDLFQNPNLEIKLPKQVVNTTAKCKLLYGNGLELSNATIENGNTIKINLSGTQNNYNTETVEGTTLIIYANMEVDKLATSSDEEITLTYTNEIATENGKVGIAKSPIKITANAGVIATNNVPELKVETIGNEGTKEVAIEHNSSERNVSINIGAINNEPTAIKNVSILGKFPTDTAVNNLGAVIDKGINIVSNTQNVKVYYSNKENTNTNLKDSSNEWSQDVNNTLAKTFLIVIDKLEASEKFEANYIVKLASNLGYNKEALLGYSIDYTNDLTGETKNVKATELKLTTGTEAEIKTTLKAFVGGEEIKENEEVKAGEIIKYNLSLKNEGKLVAENASLEVTIPDNTTLIEVNPKYPGYDEESDMYTYEEQYFIEKQDKTMKKDSFKLDAGENINVSYMVRVNENLKNNAQGKTSCVVKYKDEEIKSEYKNTFVANNLVATIEPYDRDANSELNSEYVASYILEIKNLNNVAQNNIEVTLNKNALVDISSIKCHIEDKSEDLDPSKNTFKIETIPANKSAFVEIDAYIKPVTDELKNVEINALIKNNGALYRTNMLSESVVGVKVDAIQKAELSSNTDVLYSGDAIKYTINIKNTGKIDANNLDLKDDYSNYLNVVSVKVDGNEYEFEEIPNSEESNSIHIAKSLKAGEETTLEFIGSINDELNIDSVKEIVNQLSVYDEGTLVGQTEAIKYNLVNVVEQDVPEEKEEIEDEIDEELDEENQSEDENKENPEQQENSENKKSDENKQSENEDENKGSTISGTAWHDANENGSKEQGEDFIQGITATLINLKDNTSKNTNTNEEGKYSFDNVEDGEYIVIFDYDTQKYMLTTYQADGISSYNNSDVENVKLKINGETLTKASTNTLKINGTNIDNVDIGLIDAKVFDLRLSKTISKVTISNGEGTQNIDYNDATLAKAEIRAKHLNGSTAIVEYRIKVTNNGEIAGYATSIVDYKPTDLSFNSSLNKEWYQSGNNLYSTALANTLIEPGETKELTLILTKTMTETNTGLTNNIAEIAETYNALGVANRDSTPGNKDTKENDTGTANVIISVSTGTAISYIALTLSIIALVATVSYITSKKILKENIKL